MRDYTKNVFSGIFWNYKIPVNRRKDFRRELVQQNLTRLRFALPFLFVVLIFLVITDFFFPSLVDQRLVHFYRVADLVITFLMFAIGYFLYSKKSISSAVGEGIIGMTTFTGLNYGALISIAEVSAGNGLVTYIGTLFIFSSLFYLQPWQLVLGLSSSIFMLVFGYTSLNFSSFIPYEPFLVILTLVPLAYVINRIHINTKMDQYISKIAVLENNKTLEEKVQERTAEIAKINKILKKGIYEKMLAERNLKETNVLLKALLEATPLPIIGIDNEGKVNYFWNKAAERSFGWKEHEVMHKPLPIIPQKYKEEFSIIKELTSTGKIISGTTVVRKNKFEKEFRFSHYAAPLYNSENNIIGHVSVLLDVSKQMKYEKWLERAKTKAEEADKLKTVFLANMSHEIRTPMNGIVGFAQLLNHEGLSKTKREQYFSIINNNCNQLATLVDDIIDISKIESQQLNIIEKSFSLTDVMLETKALFENYKNTLGKEHIRLRCILPEKSLSITSDELRIKQVMNNLVKNAFKFTEKGEVEFGYKHRDPVNIELYVRDTGIGIPDNKKKIIFERFRQAENSLARTYGGSGLGLAICKGIVDLLEGTIEIDSKIDEGTTFKIVLPAKEMTNKENRKALLNEDSEIEEGAFRGKSALIVEDDPYSLLFLKEILGNTGIEIISTDNGSRALEIVKDRSFDIILMDIQLPGMNGYKATQKIREMNINTPVIAQTANVFSEDQALAKKAGCNAFIGKPIQDTDLQRVLKKYL